MVSVRAQESNLMHIALYALDGGAGSCDHSTIFRRSAYEIAQIQISAHFIVETILFSIYLSHILCAAHPFTKKNNIPARNGSKRKQIIFMTSVSVLGYE